MLIYISFSNQIFISSSCGTNAAAHDIDNSRIKSKDSYHILQNVYRRNSFFKR